MNRVAWVVRAAGLAFVAWLCTWHCWLGALWWAVAVSGRVRGRWWLALFVSGLVAAPWTVWRYAVRVDVLTARVVRGGADALGVVDCLAIYGLNLVMAGTGLVLGFPEVAAETASLVVPGNDASEWRNNRFPACVPKVAAVIDDLRAQPVDGVLSGRRLAWTYGATGSSVRGALALTPATVSGRRLEGAVEVRTSVPIDYPDRFRLVLVEVGGLAVGVEEGLFNALEERGWLHPYTLTWVSRVPDGPLPDPCEAWTVRLFSGWTPGS